MNLTKKLLYTKRFALVCVCYAIAAYQMSPSIALSSQGYSGNFRSSNSESSKLSKPVADFGRKPGLPSSPWYKHRIYAPGMYTGYDVKTLPGMASMA